MGQVIKRIIFKKMPDKMFIKRQYRQEIGEKLNLKSPKTFTEKMQWLKLYNRKPLYTVMVDKFAVKEYVADLIGNEYVIPTLGVWNRYDEIDFDVLPDKFVLKCTHDSGSVRVIKDKCTIDHNKMNSFFAQKLAYNYFYNSREWPYKNVNPRIIAEPFIEDDLNPELRVYKVFNFSGVPKIIQMITGDKTDHEYINYYDTKWNLLDLQQNYPNGPIDEKPECLEDILDLSAKLSQDLPFVRTDFYMVDGKVLFSEFTFFSDAGMVNFEPEEWNAILGDMIVLPSQRGIKRK